MSQIQFVNPSRLGPTPGESRVPSAVDPAGGASSFDDHLERAGRPAEQTPRGESKSALATPKDETPAQRDAEVDDGQSDESSPTGAPQSEAGTAEDSTGDDITVQETTAEAEAAQPVTAQEDANADDDILQLSKDAELIELQSSTGDAAEALVAVGVTEIATIDEARSVIAAARRRGSGGSDESSSASAAHREAANIDAEVDVDVPNEKSGDDGRPVRFAAAGRRAGRSDTIEAPERIGTEQSEDAGPGTSSVTHDERAVAKVSVEGATNAVAAGDLIEDNTRVEAASATDHRQAAAEIASSPGGERPHGLVDSDAPASVREVEPSSGQPPSREHKSPVPSTSAAEVAEAKPTKDMELAVDTHPIDIEGDRPDETTGRLAKLVLESTAEMDRTASQRNTISVGSRLATARPGEGERGSVDRARFVGRVAGAFAAAGREGGEVRLRLHPPELGVVRLEVKLEAGVLTARFETETPSARTALLENMAALRERLAEQGIKIEKFNVDLMDRRPEDTPYGSPGSHDRQQDDSSPNAADAPKSLDRRDASSEEPQPSTPAPAGSTGELNVVI